MDSLMTDEERIFIGPASKRDTEQRFRWRWEVLYRGQRRGGACATREEAQREAAAVLKLLRERQGR
jgi:hypothetical protein